MGKVIEQLEASDGDEKEKENSKITYRIEKPESSETLFEIDPRNGQVKITKQPEIGQYYLTGNSFISIIDIIEFISKFMSILENLSKLKSFIF